MLQYVRNPKYLPFTSIDGWDLVLTSKERWKWNITWSEWHDEGFRVLFKIMILDMSFKNLLFCKKQQFASNKIKHMYGA
jgi:hypothetical protein